MLICMYAIFFTFHSVTGIDYVTSVLQHLISQAIMLHVHECCETCLLCAVELALLPQ